MSVSFQLIVQQTAKVDSDEIVRSNRGLLPSILGISPPTMNCKKRPMTQPTHPTFPQECIFLLPLRNVYSIVISDMKRCFCELLGCNLQIAWAWIVNVMLKLIRSIISLGVLSDYIILNFQVSIRWKKLYQHEYFSYKEFWLNRFRTKRFEKKSEEISLLIGILEVDCKEAVLDG